MACTYKLVVDQVLRGRGRHTLPEVLKPIESSCSRRLRSAISWILSSDKLADSRHRDMHDRWTFKTAVYSSLCAGVNLPFTGHTLVTSEMYPAYCCMASERAHKQTRKLHNILTAPPSTRTNSPSLHSKVSMPHTTRSQGTYRKTLSFRT